MGRKISELILPTTRMFPIAGEQACWREEGYARVAPGTSEWFRLQAPNRIRMVIDQIEIHVLDVTHYVDAEVRIWINGIRYEEESQIFNPVDSVNANQIHHPRIILVPAGEMLEIELMNLNMAAIFIEYLLEMRIFTERLAN